METNLATRLKAKAQELGFDDCRIASATRPESIDRFEQWLEKGHHATMAWLERGTAKRSDPSLILPNIRSVITLCVSYHHPESPPSRAPVPIARYAQHEDYHDVLKNPLKTLAEYLDASAAEPDARSLWYVDTGPILERDAAQRSGLGFIGKHNNLIHTKLGNWTLLSEILTTVALEPDTPTKNHCGKCQACLDACPTQALVGPFELDSRLCISYWTIENKGPIPEALRPSIGGHAFGCDDCLAVCPWNRFAKEGALMRQAFREDLARPRLNEWLTLDDTTFRKRFRGTPLFRTKRRGILRNVAVALGNTGSLEDRAALEKASRDDDPLVAEHATWGLARLEERRSQGEISSASSSAG